MIIGVGDPHRPCTDSKGGFCFTISPKLGLNFCNKSLKLGPRDCPLGAIVVKSRFCGNHLHNSSEFRIITCKMLL